MLGETIRDVWLEATPAQRRSVGQLLALRKDPPKDWNKLKTYLTDTAPDDPDLGAFVPSRSDRKDDLEVAE